jgi:hypothetical protein
MKEIQIGPEGNPNFFGRKSKENRKEIQAFVFRESSLFNDLRRPRSIFFSKPIRGVEQRWRVSAPVVRRRFGIHFLVLLRSK